MITWVLFLGIGLVVGVIAGLYFARLDDVSNKQKMALQQKLESAEQQLKAYQSQVTEHFLQTASLVNSMTDSYRAVHEHLAMGARELCDSQVNVAQLEMPSTQLLDNTAAAPAEKDKPVVEPKIHVSEKEVELTAEQGEAVAAQPSNPEVEPETAHKPESVMSEEAAASQPADQEETKEAAEAAMPPPATPESLHVEDEAGAPQSLKDSEQTAATANVSRMVH